MSQLLDNLQFVVDLMVKNPILHELSLLELLDGKHFTVILSG